MKKLILVFTDEEAQKQALQLNWAYANKSNTDYDEITQTIDKL